MSSNGIIVTYASILEISLKAEEELALVDSLVKGNLHGDNRQFVKLFKSKSTARLQVSLSEVVQSERIFWHVQIT